MERRALLVAINTYDYIRPSLTWCADDALAMYEVLRTHANRDPNYACHVTLGYTPSWAKELPPPPPTPDPDPASQGAAAPLPPSEGDPSVKRERVTFTSLRLALEDLFKYHGSVLFYFSGHGLLYNGISYLATQDGLPTLPGLRMQELLDMANASAAREVLLIIDSCYSGGVGAPEGADDVAHAYLRPGVTLLAGAQASQLAAEVDGHGVFTRLLLGALKGGAADVRGRVSAASTYAYVEQALGPWDQRPIYRSNASTLAPIRNCEPDIADADLRLLPQYFSTPEFAYGLDRTYEVTEVEVAIPEHINIFNLFKQYQVSRLLRPSFDDHLYFAAMNERTVELTPLGQFYWRLAKAKLLGEPSPLPPNQPTTRRRPVPDPESVAKLFHEAYERLAPTFQYETRQATRVRWENVPAHNKNLMIATAAEVLATLFPLEEQADAAPHPAPTDAAPSDDAPDAPQTGD